MTPDKKSICLLTIRHAGMDLTIAGGDKSVCSRNMAYEPMEFKVAMDAESGGYSIEIENNSLTHMLLKKYNTNTFETLVESVDADDPNKVLLSLPQKSTKIILKSNR